MILKVLLALCIIGEFIFVPLYQKAYWPEPNKKSFKTKLVAATLFLFVGVLSMFIAGNFSTYAALMMTGLVLGWIGDILMHIPNKKSFILLYIGTASFLVGHIFYIISFIKSTTAITGNSQFISLWELAAFAIIYVFSIILLFGIFHFKFENKFMRFGVLFYIIFLAFMLVKAISFGVSYYTSGAENGLIAIILLIVGGIFFFISDATLGIRLMGGKKDSRAVLTTSIFTYFSAQTLLALSIMFVNV